MAFTPKKLEHEGEALTVKQWGARLGVSYDSIHKRLGRGETIGEIIAQPTKSRATPVRAATPPPKAPRARRAPGPPLDEVAVRGSARVADGSRHAVAVAVLDEEIAALSQCLAVLSSAREELARRGTGVG